MNAALRAAGRDPVFSASALELARRERIAEAVRPPSFADEIRAARSPHQVEWILHHFELTARRASRKTREQLQRTAYVRRCELAGVLP